MVYLPEGSRGRLPVMVYCHGWGGSQKLPPVMERLQPKLEAAGTALLSFDFFGCGETGGSYSEMTYGRWHRNLADIFAWLAAQAWADPTRAGCFAISSGTTAMMRFASEARAPAYAISVASCLGAFIGMPNPPGRILVEHLDSLVAGKTAELFGTQFGLEFFRDFLSAAPIYTLNSITCPVFFLQGGADNP
ncbi:MAG: X-Pro dipeptidyl-peptidase family [Verrucomicrobia bacterium]|nr:X-Pro dipeptidyl-peptidase family [Verrucomicrobiota bacterium]